MTAAGSRRMAEAAHFRRTLPGWVHGPHDTLVRIRPQTVAGFRLTHEGA